MENSFSFFYFSDIKKLFLGKKYLWICVFFLSFILTAFFLLIREPKFEAKSSFFEDTEKTQTIGNLKDIVLSDSYIHSSDAFSFLKTKSLNKKLVEKLGLQISVVEDISKFKRLYFNFLKNLNLTFNSKIQDEEIIEFSDVCYEKSSCSCYYLKFLDKSYYEIYDSEMKMIEKHKISESVITNDLCFTINKIPQKFIKKIIKIKIEPWIAIVNNLLKNIEITKEKSSPNFLLLKMKYGNEVYSSKILNTLMDIYHEQLVNENESLIRGQIDYLENRKNVLEKDLFSLIDENEKQISLNVKTKGFTDLNTEVETLLSKRENYQRQFEQTSKDLDNLKNINLNDIDKNYCLSENIINIIDEIKRYQDKKKAIQISINEDLSSKENLQLPPIKSLGLKKLINEKKYIEDFSIVDKSKNSVFVYDKFKNYKNDILSTDLLNITADVNHKIDLIKSNDYEPNNKNLSILDLNVIKDIYVELDKSKEDLKLEITQIKHVLKNINLKDFQITTLSNFLSSDLLKNIIDISKKINDEQNYTSKEIETLKQEYDLEKKYLISHLEELLNFKNLNLKLINQKIFSLKKDHLNLITNEISFLSTKAKDLITKNIYEKNNEKRFLEKNLIDIKISLQNLVSKMTDENKFIMKSEMIKNMIESLTKLIESKKLDLNLKKINSRPVDQATTNIYPIHIFRNSFIVAFLSIFVFFMIYLYLTILIGFPVSIELIKSLSFDYCGKISCKCDGIEVKNLKETDLESLRSIISTIDGKQKIITSICSKGPNYIHYLAALLSVIGKNVLVIETKSEVEDKNGLFPSLEKDIKKLPIQKIQAYDFLPAGEKKYFAFELLKSYRFTEKLEQIKSKYDLILIYSDAKIDSAEARIYLDFSDKVVLTFNKETLEDVKLFVNWAVEKKKLCFVTY